MATWGCVGCRTSYRVRLFRCPRCHGTAFEEENMPKISRSGGATHAAAGREREAEARPPASGPEREHQLNAPSEGVEIPADGTLSPEIEGDGSGEALPPAEVSADGTLSIEVVVEDGEGEQPSAGSSSETSPPRPPSSPVTSGSDLPKRAPKTGSRSGKGRTGSSTARSTGGSGEGD
jgi:hypothetical protein